MCAVIWGDGGCVNLTSQMNGWKQGKLKGNGRQVPGKEKKEVEVCRWPLYISSIVSCRWASATLEGLGRLQRAGQAVLVQKHHVREESPLMQLESVNWYNSVSATLLSGSAVSVYRAGLLSEDRWPRWAMFSFGFLLPSSLFKAGCGFFWGGGFCV